VFSGEKKETKLTDKDQYMRTYCAIKPTDEGKGIIIIIIIMFGEKKIFFIFF
jgi:hypothetical protein